MFVDFVQQHRYQPSCAELHALFNHFSLESFQNVF